MSQFVRLPPLGERELNEISRLIEKARSLGFIDVYSNGELVEFVLNSREGDVYAVLHRPGRLPVLVNAGLEGDYVSIALLDLSLTLTFPVSEYPELKEFFDTLEGLTTRFGLEKYGDKSIAPFLYPLAVYENEGLVSVIIGVKSAIHVSLFNENYVESLLENLLLNYEGYVKELIECLRKVKGEQG